MTNPNNFSDAEEIHKDKLRRVSQALRGAAGKATLLGPLLDTQYEQVQRPPFIPEEPNDKYMIIQLGAEKFYQQDPPTLNPSGEMEFYQEPREPFEFPGERRA